jgi:predicted O-methyltransferase YrrM
MRAGPVFDIAYSVLATESGYHAFLQGGDRQSFGAFLDSISAKLTSAGLPAEDVHFAKRYPPCAERFAAEALLKLAAAGFLPHTDYDKAWYEKLACDIRLHHEHGSYRTYIYPEEARLLFAIADIARPRSAAFLGSYYGYWAHAALATIARHGGSAVLVDPDPAAQDVARRNLARARLLGPVEVMVSPGEEHLQRAAKLYDMVVLDAEGPRDHPDPEQRGKRVYAPLLRHALPRMTADALLVCHNILFEDIAGCSYFDRIIERNRDELGPFLRLVADEFPGFVECASTEGVGVGRRMKRSGR